MNALHNRLIDMFEAATNKDLVEDAAFTYLQDLATFIEAWSTALNYAKAGDEEKTLEFLRIAFRIADETDRRKKFLRRSSKTPFVRYHEIKG